MRLIAALALSVMASVSANAAESIYQKNLEHGWTVSCYKYDKGGFSHCVLSTTFVAKNERQRRELRASDMYFGVALIEGVDQGMSISVGSKDWSIVNSKDYSVKIYFPKQNYTVRSKGFVDGDVTMIIGKGATNDDLMADLMKSKNFVIEVNGKSLGGFNLRGSAEAIKHLYGVTLAFQGRGGETFPSSETF